MRAGSMLVCLFAVVGCEEPIPAGPDAAAQLDAQCASATEVQQPLLELGLGVVGFEEPIEEGDVLDPAWGGQGGRHLEIAVRASGLAPGVLSAPSTAPRFTLSLFTPDDEVLAEQSMPQQAMRGDEALAELNLGPFLLWEVPSDGAAYVLHVTAEDACGTALTAERSVLFAD